MFLFDVPLVEPIRHAPVNYLWYFLPIGYLTTIFIETIVLLFGLSPKLSTRQKILCGIWLTACTYPIVVLVLPVLLANFSKPFYLIVAETFAPAAECALFWFAFRGKKLLQTKDWMRCFVTIVFANLASFGIGEILNYYSWFGLF